MKVNIILILNWMSLASAAHCSVFRFSTKRIITRTVFDIAKLQAIDHDDEA